MASAFASKAGLSLFEKHLKNYEPADPIYETYTDDKGKTRQRKRDLPLGLSDRDAKVLRKVKKRARRLDKSFSFCGVRFGWTFIIGLIPVAGDAVNAGLNYLLVVRKAEEAEIPGWLIRRMLMNNLFSTGVGLVPFVGDVIVATFKANSRNAALLEEYLRIRGDECLKAAAKRSQDLAVVTPSSGSGSIGGGPGKNLGSMLKTFASRKEKKVSVEPNSAELGTSSAQRKSSPMKEIQEK